MPKKQSDIFTKFTTAVALAMGQPWIFTAALVTLLLWGISGPILQFSDTWQLIINTSTTIITFLMVFIIQNTQNRDNLALNIKLDAIMAKLNVSEDELFVAEEESDSRLEEKKKKMQQKVTRNKKKGKKK